MGVQTAVSLWRRDLGAMAGVLTHSMPTSQGPGSAGCPWGQPGQAAAAGEGGEGVQGMQLLLGSQQSQHCQPWHRQGQLPGVCDLMAAQKCSLL